MPRHDLDVFSLITGAIFVAVGMTCLAAALTDTYARATVLAPLMLLGIGVAGLAASARCLRGPRRSEDN